MKKSFIVLLAVVCLWSNAACAESLPIKLGVPASVTEPEMKTSTGFTTITMDALVEMPDVSSVSTYEVVPRIFSEEEALEIVHGFGFNDVKKVTFEIQSSTDGNWTSFLDYTQQSFSAENRKHVLHLSNGLAKEKPARAIIQFMPRNMKMEFTPIGPVYQYEPENAGKFAYSREEAMQMAVELAAKVAPDLSLNASGVLTGSQVVESLKDSGINATSPPRSLLPHAYVFIFTRTIDGIPVTVSSQQITSENSYTPPFWNEQLNIVISDSGIDSARYWQPYELKGVLRKNVQEFLSFDSVLDIAKNILPLKLVTREGINTRTTQVDIKIHIDRISFGYMRVQMRNQPGQYELIPVWDFFGTSVSQSYWDGAWHETYYSDTAIESHLTVNAMDGTVVDREYGY